MDTIPKDAQFRIATVVIEPNKVYGDAFYGNKFYIIDATGTVFLKTNNTPTLEYKQGQGQSFSQPFKRIEIENRSSTQNLYVKIWVGFGEFIDRRFQLIESNTIYKSNVLTSIAATTAEILTGIPSDNEILRKSVLVSNNDSSNNLELRDRDNVSGLIIFPKTSVMIPTSDYIEVYNPTGSAIACRVSELWYIT